MPFCPPTSTYFERPIDGAGAEKSLAAGIANAEIAMTIRRVDRAERSVIHVQDHVQAEVRLSHDTIKRLIKQMDNRSLRVESSGTESSHSNRSPPRSSSLGVRRTRLPTRSYQYNPDDNPIIRSDWGFILAVLGN